MKTRNLFNVIIALFLIQSTLMAKDFEFGIGFTAEYPQKADFDYYIFNISLEKIYLPVTLFSHLRLIPEVAYWNYKYEYQNNSSKIEVLQFGIGVYYSIPIKKTNVYFGPRFSALNMSAPDMGESSHRINEKTDKIYGITFGAEHKVISHFSIGFEIQYNYYEDQPWMDYEEYNSVIHRNLDTVFVFTFHL